MRIADNLRVMAKDLRRTLRLSPMHKVFRRLKQQGVNLRTVKALEVFGGDGQNHTKDIASVVAELEIWEIDPECESALKRKFPESEIKITDSYAEIKRIPQKYDLVVVDNSSVAFDHYEHFDLFPDIFRVLSDPAVMILNTIPKVSQREGSERLRQRQTFYNAVNAADITFDEIEKTYRTLASQNGWTVEWIFFERRWTFSQRQDTVYYAALKLKQARI